METIFFGKLIERFHRTMENSKKNQVRYETFRQKRECTDICEAVRSYFWIFRFFGLVYIDKRWMSE